MCSAQPRTAVTVQHSAAALADHKNSLGSFVLPLFMLIQTEEKETKTQQRIWQD